MASKKSKSGRRSDKGLQGRRFTEEQRQRALTLIAGGMQRTEVAASVGTTTESLRRWVAKAQADGTMPAGPTRAAAPALVDKKTQPVAVATDTSAKRAAPRSPYAPTDPAQAKATQAGVLRGAGRARSATVPQMTRRLSWYPLWYPPARRGTSCRTGRRTTRP